MIVIVTHLNISLYSYSRYTSLLKDIWGNIDIEMSYYHYMEVWWALLNWGYPQLIHFSRVFHSKPSIWGYPLPGNPRMMFLISISLLLLVPSGTWTVRPWKSPIFFRKTQFPTPMTARVYVNLLDWLVVWNIFLLPYIGNNHPNGQIICSEGLKPPTISIDYP